jgi:hypothetical protein
MYYSLQRNYLFSSKLTRTSTVRSQDLHSQGVSSKVVHSQAALKGCNTSQVLKPHADDLLTNVVFPLMCHNAEDARLWAEDPQEYIRRVGAHWQCFC